MAQLIIIDTDILIDFSLDRPEAIQTIALLENQFRLRANCKYIVTYNKADFQDVDKFNIELATAKEFLQIIQELP